MFGGRASSGKLEVSKCAPELCVPADASWDARTRRKLSGGSPRLLVLFGSRGTAAGWRLVPQMALPVVAGGRLL